MAPTPNVQRVVDEITARWPGLLRFEFYNRRHIGNNPLRRWSQHAGSEPARGWYGNAVDIFDPADSWDSLLLDDVNAFLSLSRSRLHVNELLWRVKAHHNHIHTSTWPKMRDVPWYRPPPKGKLVTVGKDGTISDTFATDDQLEDIVLKKGDSSDLVAWYQALLNSAGRVPPLTVDGDFGSATESAVKWYQAHLKEGQTGMIDGPLAAKLSSFSNSKDGRYAPIDHGPHGGLALPVDVRLTEIPSTQ